MERLFIYFKVFQVFQVFNILSYSIVDDIFFIFLAY